MVGKPSAGKSTFFKASTLADVDIANYPFTTIKPNQGVGFVSIKDVAEEFGKKANPRVGYCRNHKRLVPIDLIDVAGLVPDAHKGEGMGLEFLNDLNMADGLIHVVDVSGSVDEKGNSVDPLSYDPVNDILFLEKELDYWYLNVLKKGWEKFARQLQQEHRDVAKSIAKQLSGLKVTEEMVKIAIKNLPSSPSSWSESDLLSLATELRKKSKPMIIAANKIDIPGAYKNLENLKKRFPDYKIISCSAETELALKEADKAGLISYVPGEDYFKVLNYDKLNDAQKNAINFMKKFLDKFKTTGVQEVLNTMVFDVLNYIAIHPGGVAKLEDSEGRVLPDCFLMKNGTTALDFAYKLHTDFGDNFIKAINVKTKLPIGKDHILEHLDVIEIMSGK